MSAPLRVTVVTAFAALGGSERWLLSLLDHARDRLDPEVWLLQDGPLAGELRERGVPVVVLPTGPSGADVARRAIDLGTRLRGSTTDVVLANGVKAAAVAVPAARRHGVPVAWAKHDYSLDRRLARPLGRLADLVVATSAGVAAATGRADAVLVPPPLDRPVERTDRAAARAWWAGHGVVLGSAPTLVMATRLVRYKGVDTAVAALAGPGAGAWRLVVVGPTEPSEPGEPARLRDLAERLGVADRVDLVGELDGVGRHLAAFDAAAVLTRRDGDRGREGYSMVALEALAAGVPLVGAQQNPEVVRLAAACGRVVPPDDPPAVARALASLSAMAAHERDDLADRGRAAVADHPDAATCARRVVAALADVAGRPGAGLGGPPVSVLSCFRDESGHVDGVVAGVVAQLGPDDEYLLLDDRSRDRTRAELTAWVDRDPRLRLLTGPGVNLSAARNHGFAAARHAVVACTDAGCLPATEWLAGLRAPFAEDPPPDLVVGAFDVDRGDPVRDACRVALFPDLVAARRRTPGTRLATRLFGRRFDRTRLDGRSMATTVAAWRAAGGFDEALRSSEDAVFGNAVLAGGGRSVLALDAAVTWEQAGSLRATARTFHTYGRWDGRAGNLRLVRRDVARGAAYLLGPSAAVLGGRRTRAVVGAAGLAYLAPPLARARRERTDPRAVALVPLVLALKDVAKASGCLRGVLEARRGRA